MVRQVRLGWSDDVPGLDWLARDIQQPDWECDPIELIPKRERSSFGDKAVKKKPTAHPNRGRRVSGEQG